MQTLLIAFLLCLSTYHKKLDYIDYQWAVGLGLTSIPIGIRIARRMGTWFGCFAAYFIVNACSIAFYRYGKTFFIPIKPQAVATVAVFDTALGACLLFGAVFFMSKQTLERVKAAIPVFTCINAIGVIAFRLLGWGRMPEAHGLIGPISLDYSGMNGVLIALGIPFLLPNKKDVPIIHDLKWFGLIASFGGVILSRSCIPYGVFAVCLLSYFIDRINWKIALSFIFPFAFCYYRLGDKMFQSSHRFEMYKVFMRSWHEQGWHFFGSGPGTFKAFSEPIQRWTGFMIDWYRHDFITGWIHSDHLQTVFEYGIMGYFIALVAYSQGMYRLWKSNERGVFSLSVGIFAAAVFDYPFRYFSTAFLLTFVLVYSLRKDLLEFPKSNL